MEEQAVWLWSPWSSRWKWTEVPLGRQPDTSFLNVPIVHNTWLYPDQKSSRILFGFKTQGGTKRNWDDSYHLIYPLPVHSTTHMCMHAHTHTYMYTHTHTHTHRGCSGTNLTFGFKQIWVPETVLWCTKYLLLDNLPDLFWISISSSLMWEWHYLPYR